MGILVRKADPKILSYILVTYLKRYLINASTVAEIIILSNLSFHKTLVLSQKKKKKTVYAFAGFIEVAAFLMLCHNCVDNFSVKN